MHHSSSPSSVLVLPAKNHILLPTGLVTMKPHTFPLAHGAHTHRRASETRPNPQLSLLAPLRNRSQEFPKCGRRLISLLSSELKCVLSTFWLMRRVERKLSATSEHHSSEEVLGDTGMIKISLFLMRKDH